MITEKEIAKTLDQEIKFDPKSGKVIYSIAIKKLLVLFDQALAQQRLELIEEIKHNVNEIAIETGLKTSDEWKGSVLLVGINIYLDNLKNTEEGK